MTAHCRSVVLFNLMLMGVLNLLPSGCGRSPLAGATGGGDTWVPAADLVVADLVAADLTPDQGGTCANGVKDGDETGIDCGGSCQPCFQVEDIRVGSPTVHYVDPEFIVAHDQHKMVYNDSGNTRGGVWVADIDPLTGKLTGTDIRLDNDVATIAEAITNGAEWGADKDGLAVFYTKWINNVRQVFRAELRTPVVIKQLTSGATHSVHWLGTVDPARPSIDIFVARFIQGPVVYWTGEDAISFNHMLSGYYWTKNGGPRFVAGTRYLVYAKQIQAGRVEVVRIDMDSGAETVVTNDQVAKVNPFGFVAPEYGDEICYAAQISDTEVGVYRKAKPGDAYASRIATITVPSGDKHSQISSLEMVEAAKGRLDRTYFAFRGADSADFTKGDGSMWIASLGSDPAKRFVRRVDEGALSGAPGYRIEPEFLVGKDEVFLYYNAYKPPMADELRKCRTGIYLK